MAPQEARRLTGWPDNIHFAVKGGGKFEIGSQHRGQPTGPSVINGFA
jgi:hypothetical protein